MKVVIIDGSPRKRANTTGLLDVLQKELSASVEVDRIRIADYDIAHCNGCLSCEQTNKCVTRDAMDALCPRLEAADVIVMGSPVYFGNVTGMLKDLWIARTHCIGSAGSATGWPAG
jgi:multimeric flavodoxin WrbA